MTPNKIKILMGMPSKSIKIGGPITHLPYLYGYFKQHDDYEIRRFDYGSKKDGGALLSKKESILKKVVHTICVFINFLILVIQFRPNIIHLNTAFDRNSLIRDIPFSIFCYIFRRRLIFKIHGSSYDLIKTKKVTRRRQVNLFFLGAKKVGVLSEIERNEFIQSFGNATKLVVVKNIVYPIDSYSGETNEFFTRIPSKIYCLFVSRIVENKGLDDVIHALPEVLKNYPQFVLIIAGDGPQKNSYELLAKELGLESSIIWLGFVPNNRLVTVLNLSDVFIFPSRLPEGMPMSLIEALRSGIPIITSKVRFALNYLEDKKNCIFFETGSIKDISEKTLYFLNNRDKFQEIMKNNNTQFVDGFNQQTVGMEFEIIYAKMLMRNE